MTDHKITVQPCRELGGIKVKVEKEDVHNNFYNMKAYTDIEQSKKLAEILPTESADMFYRNNGIDVKLMWEHNAQKVTDPCWSLAALFDVLPEGVIENYYAPNLQKENGKYSIAYGDEELLCEADNPIDACYEMIIKLKGLKKL